MAKQTTKVGLTDSLESSIDPATEDKQDDLIDVAGPIDAVASGQKTISSAGTAETLATSTAIVSVTIKALAANTGNVYVGGSNVDDTNGFVLAKGDTVSLDVDNLADVYLDVDTNGEGVSFIYIYNA